MKTANKPRFLFWFADELIVCHTILTVLGIAWAFLIAQPGIGIVMIIMFVLALPLWMEWKNSL